MTSQLKQSASVLKDCITSSSSKVRNTSVFVTFTKNKWYISFWNSRSFLKLFQTYRISPKIFTTNIFRRFFKNYPKLPNVAKNLSTTKTFSTISEYFKFTDENTNLGVICTYTIKNYLHGNKGNSLCRAVYPSLLKLLLVVLLTVSLQKSTREKTESVDMHFYSTFCFIFSLNPSKVEFKTKYGR